MKPAAPTGRRRLLGGLLAAGAAVAALPAAAQSPAQGFPSKPIQIVVGFAAGTTTDTIARVAAEQLRTRLGQPVVVINKPGANGVIGATEVARPILRGRESIPVAGPGPPTLLFARWIPGAHSPRFT